MLTVHAGVDAGAGEEDGEGFGRGVVLEVGGARSRGEVDGELHAGVAHGDAGDVGPPINAPTAFAFLARDVGVHDGFKDHHLVLFVQVGDGIQDDVVDRELRAHGVGGGLGKGTQHAAGGAGGDDSAVGSM